MANERGVMTQPALLTSTGTAPENMPFCSIMCRFVCHFLPFGPIFNYPTLPNLYRYTNRTASASHRHFSAAWHGGDRSGMFQYDPVSGGII